MPADADEPPAELRIGRWLPAVRGEAERAEDAPTVAVPALAKPADDGADPATRHDSAPPADVPPAGVLPPPIPPDESAQVSAPARRRTRDLTLVAAITLVLAAVVAVATAVALQAKPSGSGGEAAAPPTFPTVAATSVEASGASPSATPSATAAATPSASSPAPSATPSRGSPSAVARPGARLDVSVEAEAPSTVLGGRTRVQAMAGASGGAVVSRIGGGAVHYVRFAPIAVPGSATYNLTIHYVGDVTRRAVISVNGATAATVTCPATGGIGRVTVQVSLNAGANTIEYGNDYASAPDLDRITLVS